MTVELVFAHWFRRLELSKVQWVTAPLEVLKLKITSHESFMPSVAHQGSCGLLESMTTYKRFLKSKHDLVGSWVDG